MNHIGGFRLVLAAASITWLSATGRARVAPGGGNWPSFRGPQASGVADGHVAH
jgi:hypothetical protein